MLTPGPPVAFYQGVLDNALFAAGRSLAPGGIVAVFGEQLSDSVASAQTLPLGTSLGGGSVSVNGLAAPVYYASPGQINFQIPYETAPGPAVVQVERDNQTGNSVSIAVQAAVPRLLPLGIGNYAIAVLGDMVTFAIPTTPGIAQPPRAGWRRYRRVLRARASARPARPALDGQASPAGQIAIRHLVSARPSSPAPASPSRPPMPDSLPAPSDCIRSTSPSPPTVRKAIDSGVS